MNNSPPLSVKCENAGATVPATVRPSFMQIKALFEDQIEASAFGIMDRPLASDICAIMTEAYLMRDDFVLKISGEPIEAGVVKAVFAAITRDHVEKVIESFSHCPYQIKNKRAYIRTSLYNAFFELEASVINEVAVDRAAMAGM